MRILCAVLATVWCLGCAKQGAGQPDAAASADATPAAAAGPARPENTLKSAPTAYLRRSAGQPIPWLQWGPEVAAIARQSGRLLLVSVGAEWCASCRLMDEHTYGHANTIKILQEAYIPVKIDADERSDLDARLQTMARVMANAAGYPLTMVISPDGVPLFAGNVLPPVVEDAVSPLSDVLARVASDWRNSQGALLAAAQASANMLVNPPVQPPPATPDVLWRTPLEAFEKNFDAQHGGLRDAPRIPTPRLYSLAIHAGREWQDLQSLDRAAQTLSTLCQRSIRDLVGGGFYRSARDDAWMKPSFDRHAADNALMLEALLDAYAGTQSMLMRSCAQGVLQFIAEELPIATELSRDKGPRDILFASHIPPASGLALPGELLTFTVSDVMQALPENVARAAVEGFGMVPRPDVVPGLPMRNAPYLAANSAKFKEEELDAARRGLHQLRAQQGKPAADPISYAAPTGLLVRAMLGSAPTLGMAAPRMLALEVLNAWVRHGYRRGGGFSHMVGPQGGARGTGTLLDQAAMIRALVMAYEQTGDVGYLATAVDTAELVHQAFARPGGGYWDSLGEPWEPELIRHRGSAAYDSEAPSPGGEMALALLDLGDVLGRMDFRERAGRLIASLAGDAVKSGPFGATLGLAAWRLSNPPIQVLVVDKQAGKGTVALTDAGQSVRRVGTSVQHLTQGADGGPLVRPRAVVCSGGRCGQPTEDPIAVKNDVLAARPPLPSAAPKAP